MMNPFSGIQESNYNPTQDHMSPPSEASKSIQHIGNCASPYSRFPLDLEASRSRAQNVSEFRYSANSE